MKAYVLWIAKAIVAFLTVIATGILAGEFGNLDPWIVYSVQAVIAALGVYITANGPTPEAG